MPEKLTPRTPLVIRRPAHNLFFAIMLPRLLEEDIASAFERLKQHYPIRKMQIPTARLHVSLFNIFGGDFVPERIVALSRRVGSSIRFEEFDLVLDRALSFHNRQADKPLVLAADAQSACSVNQLVSQIREAFSVLAGFRAARTGPITPHLTLAWDRITVPKQPIPPITLPVREIVLVHSHVGKSRYDELGRWERIPCQ